MTLAEVMVATVILLVMSLIITESLRNSMIFDQLLSSRDETVRTARVVMAKLRRDLQLAYLTPNDPPKNLERYQTVFVGFNEEPDKLFFASLNHQRMYLDTREAEQTEITVWCERSEEGEGYTLYHREAPRIDHLPDEQGTIWPLAYNVRSFSLRYLDQQDNEWKDEWDTRSSDTPYRLPRAVEIALVLIAPDPNDPEDTVDVPFVTQVMLEWAPRMPTENPGGLGPGLAARAGVAASNQGGGGGAGGAGAAGGIFNSVLYGKGGYAGAGSQGLATQGSGMFAGGQAPGRRGRGARRPNNRANPGGPSSDAGARPGQVGGGRAGGGGAVVNPMIGGRR